MIKKSDSLNHFFFLYKENYVLDAWFKIAFWC